MSINHICRLSVALVTLVMLVLVLVLVGSVPPVTAHTPAVAVATPDNTLAFLPDGAHLAPGVTLRLAAVGHGEALTPIEPIMPSDDGNRVEYAHGGITEWYLRQGGGIEQGITFDTPPTGDGSLSLTIATPGAAVLVNDAGDAATLILPTTGGKSDQWRYDGLHVTDATGRVLASRLVHAAQGGIGITVEDTDAVYPITVDPYVQRQALSVSGASNFGSSVALSADGTTALVGAPGTTVGGIPNAGTAYMFTRGSSGYTLRSTLTGDSASGSFGFSVALSGDGSTALVGAKDTIGDGSNSNPAGTAYLFTRGTTGDYPQFGPVLAVTSSRSFGVSVALSTDGSTALVGASFTSVGSPSPNNAGAAYVYTRGSGSYALSATLSAAGSASFGSAVALSADGSVALIGARHTLDTAKTYLQGSAYLFTRSGSNYTQSGATLLGPVPGRTNEFGYAVALSTDGMTALVGAFGTRTAYVYTRSNTGDYTQFGPTLAVSGSDQFGSAVAMSANGAIALIGAYYTNAGIGTAYTFVRGSGGYTLNQTFAISGTTYFGNAAALTADGATALIGAPSSSNSAYVFTAATSIAVVPGSNYQHVAVTAAFPTPLAAVVRDPNGTTVSGATVTFAAPAAGASGTFACAGTCPTGTTVSPDGLSATAITDANGIATAPPFTANIAAGTYSVTATTGDASNSPLTPASFSLTNTVGPLASLTPRNGTTPQQAATGNAFAAPFAVTAADAYGNPIGGTGITFTAPASGAGGTFAGGGATATATTTISGVATAPAFTANSTTGSYTVTAAAGGITMAFSVSNASGAPTTLTANSGTTPQSATAGTTYVTPLGVTVRDSNANPVSGGSVTFTAPANGASGTFAGGALSISVTSDASGTATTAFTANGIAGAFTVTAAVNGVSMPATFSLTNTAGGAANVVASPAATNQIATVTTAFATALAVTVTDRFGNPLVNQSVTFAAPSGGSGGTFAGGVTTTAVVTTASGIATAPAFTANGTAGSYLVTATATGVNGSAIFPLTNRPGAPSSLVPGSGTTPQNATVSAAFPNPFAVTVRDSQGNAVGRSSTVTFTVNPASNGAAGSFAGGGTTVTAPTNDNGIAITPAFSANTAAGSYTVTATDGAATTAFALTNLAGTPSSVTTNGAASQHTGVGTAFGTQLSVTVRDGSGSTNPVSGASVVFAVTAADNGAGGTFTGAVTSVSATTGADGVAAAPSFTANGVAGGPYTVSATVSGAGAPATFSLTNDAGAPAALTVAPAANNQSAAVDHTFAVPLAVTVSDRFGNPLRTQAVTFRAPLTGSSGIFAAGADVTNTGSTASETTNASGVATAPSFTANSTAGTYALNVSVTGIGTPATFTLTNLPGAASTISTLTGGGQTIAAGQAFATTFSAVVHDADGNPTPNVSVTFTAPTTVGVPSGTFTGGATSVTGTTNSNGVATAPVFTANGKVGSYTVAASAAGTMAPATYALSNTAGAASAFVLTGAPGTVSSGTPFSLTVTVTDAFGNVVPTYTGTVHFTSNSGTATLPPDYPFTTGNSGQHTFAVTLNTADTGRSVTATDTGNSSLTATAAGITVRPPMPTVTGFSPPTGPTAGGTVVTITGTNLTGATVVSVGGGAGTNIGVNGAGTALTVTTPAHAAGTVDIIVTAGGQTATIHGYTYLDSGSISAQPTAHPLPGTGGGSGSVAPMPQPARHDVTAQPSTAPAPNVATPTPDAQPGRH